MRFLPLSVLALTGGAAPVHIDPLEPCTVAGYDGELDECGQRALARSYDTADPFDLDASCIAAIPRPPFLVPDELR